jgi:hypothetical protein
MKKGILIFTGYILILIVLSLVFNSLAINNDFHNTHANQYSLRLITIPTIIGGFICLYFTIPSQLLKNFSYVYAIIWILRFALLFIAFQIKQVEIFGKTYHLNVIIANYYKNTSRLETPLPFLAIWLLYISYEKVIKKSQK